LPLSHSRGGCCYHLRITGKLGGRVSSTPLTFLPAA